MMASPPHTPAPATYEHHTAEVRRAPVRVSSGSKPRSPSQQSQPCEGTCNPQNVPTIDSADLRAATAIRARLDPSKAKVSGHRDFDCSDVLRRLSKFWGLAAQFGTETGEMQLYLSEVLSDRYALVNGMQLIRDELQFAIKGMSQDQDHLPGYDAEDVVACGADLSFPCAVTTLAHTNCGDRFNAECNATYYKAVAARFATLSEAGEPKMESFSPTGGGTDDGATLAHVTVAHQLDPTLRRAIYEGNEKSYILVNFDLFTHCGRLEGPNGPQYGTSSESCWREPRAACGAIVGTLSHFNPSNGVHRRLRSDLGESNFEYLSTNRVKCQDGTTDITFLVAAAIIAIQGMYNTANALVHEMDERGVGHVTASVTVNRVNKTSLVYLGRTTVFQGSVRTQGLGTNARLYSGQFDGKKLTLIYEGASVYEPHDLHALSLDEYRAKVSYSMGAELPAFTSAH